MVFAGIAVTALSGNPKTAFADTNRFQVVDTDRAPWPAVGRLNVVGYDRIAMCTATLIGPQTILTAAHCLFDGRTGKAHRLDKLRFVAGVRRDQNSGVSSVDCVRYPKGHTYIGTPKLKDTKLDVAVVRLSRPIEVTPAAVFSPSNTKQITRETRLQAAGYRRSRKFLPTLDANCRLDGVKDGVWVTTCATEKGASGGPVFINVDNQLVVAGVLSAKLKQSRSIAVPFTKWSDMLPFDACPSSAAK
ncbi:trypsin domain-containing protein [Roseibium sp. TrichSKD4]|nr:trypsin domain-containing protein [Roseibium sp. TrichSKD4]